MQLGSKDVIRLENLWAKLISCRKDEWDWCRSC